MGNGDAHIGDSHRLLHSPQTFPWPSVSASMQVTLKFAADSKAVGCSLQPVAQCGFLKSDLSFFPLPCFSRAASPFPLNVSSGGRGRDESSDAAGEAEVKVTMGAITLNYQTLCLQRPSTLMQYSSGNLLTDLEAGVCWKWVNSPISRSQCSPADESTSP